MKRLDSLELLGEDPLAVEGSFCDLCDRPLPHGTFGECDGCLVGELVAPETRRRYRELPEDFWGNP